MNDNIVGKHKSFKELSKAMGVYTGASIIGPLVLIGGTGYLLDRHFNTKPLITIVAFFIAFILSNILLFKKAMIITRKISEAGKKEIIKKEEDINNK